MSRVPSRSGSRRPQTPKSSDEANDEQPTIPPLPTTLNSRTNSTSAAHPPRRSSLGFLRRSKSGDPVRKTPVVAPAPPKIPDLWANGAGGFHTQLLSKDVRESDEAQVNNPRSRGQDSASQEKTNNVGGYVPGRKSTDSAIGAGGEYVSSSAVPITQDPYANIGSMAHRGRYSYASSAVSTVQSPRRVRRRKDPTPFNILIVGAKNSGKTSFLKFLRQSLALKSKRGEAPAPDTDHTGTTADSGFKSTYIETEIDSERIGLTLWDSAGLERNMIDLQIRETVAFIENKFDETFSEETKVVRAPGVRDTHIHCVFLLLDPARLTPNHHYPGKPANANEVGGLDKDLDIGMLEALQGKTIVIPVVSKADTCTTKHMDHLKNLVREGLAKAKVDPLEALELEIDGEDGLEAGSSGSSIQNDSSSGRASSVQREEDGPISVDGSDSEGDDAAEKANADGVHASENASAGPTSFSAGLSFVPLSIISPDSYDPALPLGRHFPWGYADPYNESHCDFSRLKDCVFSEWRGELREKSRINWYENWRSERLGGSDRGRGARRP